MTVRRRDFLSAALAAGLPAARAQESASPKAPTRKAKVTKLFKAPDEHPNALETAADGLWIGGQVSEMAYKVDWKTGQVLHKVQTESHNTSGMAVGAGYLWMSANGGVSGRRPPRPTDNDLDEMIQADMKTGKTIKRHKLPWPGGVHGTAFCEQTQTLWVTALGINALAELDPKDNLRLLNAIPIHRTRAHGLDWDHGTLWIMYSNDFLIERVDAKTGKLLEVVTLSKEDPDPHGMCFHDGHLYYCDAGLVVQGGASGSAGAGYVCRIDL
jgi:streptogramin lyase